MYNAGVNNCHVDIMDGKFVENFGVSYEDLKNLLENKKIIIDLHLMIQDVESNIDKYLIKNVSSVAFHIESVSNIAKAEEIINKIKSKNIKAGIAINPDSKFEYLIHKILPIVDKVILMTVHPGKGGQLFIEDSISRIKLLWAHRTNMGLDFEIEIDGGVNQKVITKTKKYVDIFVSGSYLINSEISEVIKLID
jgi:ribulose-phosphate 3-epimerase